MSPSVHAQQGDLIVIGGHWPGDPRRTGKILKILGASEREHYRVRWENGRTTTYYPSSDIVIQHVDARKATRSSSARPE
jgi:hypothetical protein